MPKNSKLVAVAICAALFAGSFVQSAMAGPLSRNKYVTIGNSRGGVVLDYALRSKTIEESGRGVRFKGRCLSACTLYLSVSRACVSRGASFGFHLPYGSSRSSNMVAANYMVRSYPNWVRNWLSANGGLQRRMKVMPYDYAARYLPVCDV